MPKANNKMPAIKICGMRDPDNVKEVVELSPDFMGFIFYSGSKRFVGERIEDAIYSYIPDSIKKVGVFVAEPLDIILDVYGDNNLDIVQLHGNENPEYCASLKTLGIPVIKAFNVDDNFDFEVLKPYLDYCDYFLFDTKGDKPGGTGKKFNWGLLSDYNYDIPFFLSGGIGVDDVDELKIFSHPMLYAIDINSKFEVEPGLKDVKMLTRFFKKFKKSDN
jgi:phosphoribosylanthranilate isomerase